MGREEFRPRWRKLTPSHLEVQQLKLYVSLFPLWPFILNSTHQGMEKNDLILEFGHLDGDNSLADVGALVASSEGVCILR